MRVLAIGAHPDDVEIGIGGLFAANPYIEKYCLVFTTCKEMEGQQDILKEQMEAYGVLGVKAFETLDFKVRQLDTQTYEIRNKLYETINEVKPDLVLTHNPNELHTDHATVGKQTVHMTRHLNTWCYEIIRSDNPEWKPNIYYPLTEKDMETKIKALECYKSQFKRGWYNTDNFINWAKTRGLQAGKQYSESYWSPRICVKNLTSF